MPRTLPPQFVYGNPPDDPGCNLNAYLFIPPAPFTAPYPGVAITRAGHFSDGGIAEAYDTCIALQAAGFLVMFGDVRLMVGPPSGGHGLPGQTTDGKWSQQSDDFKILVRYLRAHELCDGFVGSLGGSGSATHAILAALSGTEGDDMTECGIGLSGMYDASDRDADILANPSLIDIVTEYYRSTDLPTLLTRSVVSAVTADQHAVYISNGTAENMPYSMFTHMTAAMDSAGVTNYIAHTNTQDGSARHSFGTFPENQSAIISFLNNQHAQWNGGEGGGRKPRPKGLFDLVPAPDGHIGDISGKAFLTLDSIKGGRFRLNWKNINTADGVYDWSELDAAMAVLVNNGKLAGLSVAAGCLIPTWAQSGVTMLDLSADDQSVQGYTQVPAVWQTNYLTRWEAFVTALGARYDSNPALAYVIITGFMQDEPMQYLRDDADLAAADIVAQADGYANAITAWEVAAKACIDAFMTAFPTTNAFAVTVDKPFSDTGNQGAIARDAVLNYGTVTYGDLFGKEFTNLQATLPPHTDPGDLTPNWVNIRQPIHFSTYQNGIYVPPQPNPYPPAPQPLEDNLLHGWEVGANLIEVYEGDVNNSDPASRQVLDEVAALLDPQAPPPPPDTPVITSPLTAEGTSQQPFNYQITATNDPTAYGAVGLDNTGLTINVPTGVLSSNALGIPGTYSITILAFNQSGAGKATLVLTIDQPLGSRTPILFCPKTGLPPTPRTVPGIPLNVNVDISQIPGTTTATASWEAPLSDGGSPITFYNPRVEGGTAAVSWGGGLTASISSLNPGDADNFFVSATNAYGTGPDSIAFPFNVPDSTAPPPSSDVRGIYTLLYGGFGDTPYWQTRTFWDKSWVDGSHYALSWAQLEPTQTDPPTYVMDDLLAYLDQCDLYSKKAIISIVAGVGQPQWFKDAAGGSKVFNETGPYPGSMVYPWISTATYIAAITAVLQAVKDRTCISGVIINGIGQLEESVLSNVSTETTNLTTAAAKAGYASAVDGWLDKAQRIAPVLQSGLRSSFVLWVPRKPVPDGTPVKDGTEGLTELDSYLRGALTRNLGYLAYQFTATSDETVTPEIALVNNNSAENFAAGYRFGYISTNSLLDTSQDPASYDALTGFTNALTHASDLKAKFVEIFPEDADSTDAGYQSAMSDAQTALAANP